MYLFLCSSGTNPGMETSLQHRDRVGVQDAVLLEDYTSENAFVDNLHKRFKENLIYVSIPPFLTKFGKKNIFELIYTSINTYYL